MLAALSLVTGLSPEEIRDKYIAFPADWWTPIANISAQVSIDHAETLYSLPGIVAKEKEGRTYLNNGIASHMVGWVGLMPAEELEAYRAQGYRGDEWVGVSGLEQWGEPILAGRHGGDLYLMDAADRSLGALFR